MVKPDILVQTNAANRYKAVRKCPVAVFDWSHAVCSVKHTTSKRFVGPPPRGDVAPRAHRAGMANLARSHVRLRPRMATPRYRALVKVRAMNACEISTQLMYAGSKVTAR